MVNFKISIVLFFLIVYTFNSSAQDLSKSSRTLSKALSLKFENPDSSAFYFKQGYINCIKNKDTLNAINFLIELSDIYAHNVNYGKSYDGYWEALLLADEINDIASTARIYQALGWLYSFYKRDEEALKYFNLAIKIRKQLINDDGTDLNRDLLQSDYFSVLNLYRVNKNYTLAKVYLDSCVQINSKRYLNPKSYYLEAEEGFLLATEGDFEKALEFLNSSKLYFEENDKSYLVVVHSLIGDVYKLMGDATNSIANYKKSLKISHDLNRHLNYRLFDYESLSEVYFNENKITEAYNYLKRSKEGNEEIFGGKSSNNKHLLEIKDQYRLEKKKQNDLLNEQLILKMEHEDKVQMLQSVLLVVSLIFTLLFGYVFIVYLRNKHKNEKRILNEKQRLRLLKQNEVLELKNKELTESALRLIEKDEFISSIKKKLASQKDNIDVNVIKRMLKTIQGTPSSNWKEFEARFTTINQSFYNKLHEQYPNLSQTDQKICALVKLNFPSKDMAKLLGISVESVHTSRYRLRKKLGLDRNDNLEEFVSQF